MTASQFRAWRESRQLTRKAAAEELGVSAHAVEKWEQDKNPVPPTVSKLISQQTEFELPVETVEQLLEVSQAMHITLRDVIKMAVTKGLEDLAAEAPSEQN